jgi:Ca2+-binding EF-hand superfamily protein
MTKHTFKIGLGVAGLAAIFCMGSVREARAHGDVDAEFQKMDTNGDGKISPDEHAAGAKMMFTKMDANNDGKVTAAEMDAAHAKMEAAHAKTEKSEGKRSDKMGMSSADKIKMLDTNNDGLLTADEHAAGAKMMFTKMDTDNDGYLTKAELKAGHEKMMTKPRS